MKGKQCVKEIFLLILNDKGIDGKIGSDYIVSIMEVLMNQNERVSQSPF